MSEESLEERAVVAPLSSSVAHVPAMGVRVGGIICNWPLSSYEMRNEDLQRLVNLKFGTGLLR